MNPNIKESDFKYQCIHCGKHYSMDEVRYLCVECSLSNTVDLPPRGVMRIIYDYEKIRNEISGFTGLIKNHFLDLLPIKSENNLPKLKIGNTPLYHINKLNNKILPFHLYLKDDSQNPTWSFKDRASALVSAFAKEHGKEVIVTASTGNAGSSLAGICASAGQKAVVIVPEHAPHAKLIQIMMYGAKIIPVKGTYDEAFDLSIMASNEFGWYNRNTAYNPLTIEGKKTVSFELFEQLNFTVPERIFVPVGDGVIISGVYKGYEDLLKLGFINRIPVIVAVQAAGSDNLVRNLNTETFVIKNSNTLADSIAVIIPRNFFMARQFIKKYAGESIIVSDDEILQASVLISKQTGLFAEPASAAAFAGFLAYHSKNRINDNSKNIVLLTGSGLKDLSSVTELHKLPVSIKPELDDLIKIMA